MFASIKFHITRARIANFNCLNTELHKEIKYKFFFL